MIINIFKSPIRLMHQFSEIQFLNDTIFVSDFTNIVLITSFRKRMALYFTPST